MIYTWLSIWFFHKGARKPRPNVYDVPRDCGVTWRQLVELEPQLEELLWRARIAGGKCLTISDAQRVFDPLRSELSELIGFAGKHHRHQVLGGAAAYSVAYCKLFDAVAGLLPCSSADADCRPNNRCAAQMQRRCPSQREPIN